MVFPHLLVEAHHLIELYKLPHVLLMRIALVVKVLQGESLVLRGKLLSVLWEMLLRTASPGLLMLVIVHQFGVPLHDTSKFESL